MKKQTIVSFCAHLFAGTLLAMNKLPAPATFFELPEGKAFIIEAKAPAEGKPWVWYAPTLATYPNQVHAWYVEQFAAKGISVAGINLGEVRGSPASSEKFTAFYNEMVKRGYSKKPLLLGQSRGGLMMLAWAMRNPEKLAGLAGIYPVCNLTSWPLKNSKEAVLKDYGMTQEALLADIKKYTPHYNLVGLAKKKVPLFMVHGTKDVLVPYEDNTKLIKESYEVLGGPISVKMIEGKGHQESVDFFKCDELVDFVLKTIGAQNKPNIVVILADDLGYGDLKCYNPERSKIDTPHLSRLAEQGMRFTDAHSSSGVCSPSRYALLTGRYHWRSRLQTGIVGVMEQPLIASNRLTIAGLAKNNGYTTACFGKWHLGMGWGFEDGQHRKAVEVPLKSGDDEAPLASDEQKALWETVFSKPIQGGPLTAGFERYFGTDVPNWPPYCFVENDHTIGMPETFMPQKLLDVKPRMISRQGPGLKDWNLYEILPTIGKKACAYVREQSVTKKPFLLYMPLTSPHEPIAVNEDWKGKSKLHYYADFVMETDDIIGSVLKTIDACGIADNTIVIFTSDNGKASYTGLAELQQLGHYSSGPLRGCKFSVYEGGHRMPFIVRWPGHVKPGSVCNQLIHHTDVMATLSDILGVSLPAESGVDSFSFLSLLTGAEQPIRQNAVSCGANGVPGFRSGDWKLVLNTKPELYNLARDIGETNDLAAQEPERVKEIQAQLEKIISEGRSTSGEKQANDVQVIRYPKDVNTQNPGRKAKTK